MRFVAVISFLIMAVGLPYAWIYISELKTKIIASLVFMFMFFAALFGATHNFLKKDDPNISLIVTMKDGSMIEYPQATESGCTMKEHTSCGNDKILIGIFSKNTEIDTIRNRRVVDNHWIGPLVESIKFVSNEEVALLGTGVQRKLYRLDPLGICIDQDHNGHCIEDISWHNPTAFEKAFEACRQEMNEECLRTNQANMRGHMTLAPGREINGLACAPIELSRTYFKECRKKLLTTDLEWIPEERM